MNRTVLLIFLLSNASLADDPFACVDPDVANAFLGPLYMDRPSYSTSLPTEFVQFDAPASLTLVASQSQPNHTTAVFKTALGVQKALSVSAAAMVDAGWAEAPDGLSMGRRGFQSGVRSAHALYCHDNRAGAVSVNVRNRTGQTLVTFVHNTDPDSRSCNESAPAPRLHHTRELLDHLPLLALPEGATSSNNGMGGSSDEVNTNIDISGSLGQSGLVSYFGDQIRDQGWVYETGWSGNFSSGSVWTKNTKEDGVLIGKLHVYGGDSDPVRVRFSINPVDPDRITHNARWSSSTSHSN